LMFERKAVFLRKRTENSVLIGHNEVTDRILIISDVNGSPLPAANLEPSEALRDSVNLLFGPQKILNHHHSQSNGSRSLCGPTFRQIVASQTSATGRRCGR
jgi:hypothetical protein